MSRSHKKPYGLIDNRSDKDRVKRFWNKKVRRSKIISDGNFYKKLNFDREWEEWGCCFIEESIPIQERRERDVKLRRK